MGSATMKDLPPEMVDQIAKHLSVKSLAKLSQTSKTMRALVKHEFDIKADKKIVALCPRLIAEIRQQTQDVINAHRMITQAGYTAMKDMLVRENVTAYTTIADSFLEIKKASQRKGSAPTKAAVDGIKKVELALSKLSDAIKKLTG